jgi:hypothetical protein
MKRLGVICLAGVLGLVLAGAAHARVTRIVIDEVLPFAEPAGSPAAAIGYEQVAGRAAETRDGGAEGFEPCPRDC